MPITRTAIVDDSGAGTDGTVIDNAWKQELYNQIDAFAGAKAGIWTAVGYSAANFTATTGTWTVPGGSLLALNWTITDQHLTSLVFVLSGTMSLSAATLSLYMALPGAPAVAAPFSKIYSTFHYYISSGTPVTGTGYLERESSWLRLVRDAGGTPFPAVTSAPCYIWGQLFWPS